MTQLERIEHLMQAIREKHGSYCTFSSAPLAGGLSGYTTYIAHDLPPSHRSFNTMAEVIERFQDFLDIDNLAAYKAEIAREKLEMLYKEQEDICDQIEQFRSYLG